jgi:hypothetical protein
LPHFSGKPRHRASQAQSKKQAKPAITLTLSIESTNRINIKVMHIVGISKIKVWSFDECQQGLSQPVSVLGHFVSPLFSRPSVLQALMTFCLWPDYCCGKVSRYRESTLNLCIAIQTYLQHSITMVAV